MRWFLWFSILTLGFSPAALAIDLPAWVESVVVTQPEPGGIGAVTLGGDWLDTCVPDTIAHRQKDGAIHLEVTHPGINVGCGDAITPWSLTEEFGPLAEDTSEILGTLIAVDPQDRNVREVVAGPDLLALLHPPRRGEFHGLGNRFGPAYVSAASDVSADGFVVVGQNHLSPGSAGLITHEAFAWSPSAGMFPLGILPGGIPGGSAAVGVSADGNVVVGASSSDRGEEAFRWTLGSGIEGLGGFEEVSISRAAATSHDGSVVVGSDEFFPPGDPGGPLGFVGRAFRWTEERGFLDLGQVFGGGSSEATDVSAGGNVIVGTSRPNPFIEIAFPDISEPFRWTRESSMVGLGHLPIVLPAEVDPDVLIPIQRETKANAVSADGEYVVGSSRAFTPFPDLLADTIYADGQFPERAFVWTEEGGMVGLGDLPQATFVAGSEAIDVSGDGSRIVGMTLASLTIAAIPPEPLAVMWEPTRGARLLEEVLALDYGVDLDGWQLGDVTAISDDGTTIVGTGINPNGEQEAWRAVLSHVSPAGDSDFDGDVDGSDFLNLQQHFAASAATQPVYWGYGDFDRDGYVGRADFNLLVANWSDAHAAAPTQVPEPGAALLAVGAIAAWLFHRSRRW